MVTISRRLRQLKHDSRKDVDFENLVKKLQKDGVVGNTGTVQYFDDVKCYGFVQVNGVKCFMHISAYKGGGNPQRGQRLRVRLEGNRVVSADRIASEGT